MPAVLIIEDQPNIRRLLEANLTIRGFQTLEAASAEEGLDYLSQMSPDLILLDVVLPGISGWELLDHLHRSPNLERIPVLVFTAANGAEETAATFDNVIGCLPKPFHLDRFKDAIQQVFG